MMSRPWKQYLDVSFAVDFLRWISFALALCSFFLFSFRYAFYDHHDIMDNGYEYEYEYGHEFLLALRFGFWI